MRWLYAIPSSDTGVHSRATACSGTDVGTLDQAYLPPALLNSSLRRQRDRGMNAHHAVAGAKVRQASSLAIRSR